MIDFKLLKERLLLLIKSDKKLFRDSNIVMSEITLDSNYYISLTYTSDIHYTPNIDIKVNRSTSLYDNISVLKLESINTSLKTIISSNKYNNKTIIVVTSDNIFYLLDEIIKNKLININKEYSKVKILVELSDLLNLFDDVEVVNINRSSFKSINTIKISHLLKTCIDFYKDTNEFNLF